MFCHAIQREIAICVRNDSKQFAVIMEGTQDCSGNEQESICLPYVDSQLAVHETFVRLYSPTDTTGQTLAKVIQDVLKCIQLPISSLRAQTYDGAANMSGEFNGCQTIITRECPLVLYFHCAAHCTNPVAEATAASCSLIRDAMQFVNDLGVLYKRSTKYKNMFDIAATNEYDTPSTLKPMCATT
jgi:hypothetical protein